VLSSLAQFDLLAEELGGEVQVVEVAGKTGEGVTELLSAIAVQSDVLDLKCAPDAPAEAVVLDAKLEKGRGIVADVIVRSGSLRNGDCVVVGSVSGRVKAIYNDENVAIPVAAPSQPVRLLGLKELPVSGTELLVVENEARAKQIADRRLKIASLRAQQQQQLLSMRHVIAASATGDAAKDTAASPSNDASAGPQRPPRLSMAVVLKADSLGALEALRQLVEEIARASGDTSLHLHVASSGVGSVTQSDVDILGSSHKTSSSSSSSSSSLPTSSSSSAVDHSNGVTETMILAFNVSVADNTTKLKAKQLDVDIVRDDVIYRLEDALKHRIEDLLPQERVETKEGAARVLKVFQLKDSKNTVVAGSSIVLGRVATLPHLIKEENKKLGHSNNAWASSAAKVNGFYRVIRDGVVIHEHPMHRIELKRFKDSAGEVRAGLECGMSFDGYSDVLEGDDIECYKVTLQRRNLTLSPAFQYRPSTASSTSNASSSSSSSSLEKDKKK
jgi:translation initiation factor IF-2